MGGVPLQNKRKTHKLKDFFLKYGSNLVLKIIFQELKKYGRSCVPVYVFWNKNLEQPIILNEVLTEKYVMEVTK